MDVISEHEQITSVLDETYDNWTDDQLDEEYEDAMQWRDWWTCEYLSAEMWYRRDNADHPITRDAWVRRELEKLDKRP